MPQLAEDDLHQAVVQALAKLRGVGEPVEVQHDDLARGELREFSHLFQHGQELYDLDKIVVDEETEELMCWIYSSENIVFLRLQANIFYLLYRVIWA